MVDVAVRALTAAAAASLVVYWGLPVSANSNDIRVEGLQRVDRREHLMQSRPSFEAAQGDYREKIGRMAERVSGLVSGMKWTLREDEERGCGRPYAGTNADQVYLNVAFSAPIPDDQWPEAVKIVRDGAISLSAVTYRDFISRPGVHAVQVASPDGGDIWLGTAKTANLTARSDCRLHEDAAPGAPVHR